MILGPVSCQGCGRPVWWGRTLHSPEVAPRWRNSNRSQHRCQADRIDPELGPVRTCRKCGEEWPLDEEFFERLPAKGLFRSWCKDHHRWDAA